jgi:hypothetical protein
MKITEMNNDSLRLIRTAMQSALDKAAKEYGISIRVGSCSYSDSSARFKVEVATVGSRGVVQSKTRSDFALYATRFGLKKSDLGRTITSRGERFEIVGLKVKSSRYPVLGKRLSDGKLFKLPVEAVNGR